MSKFTLSVGLALGALIIGCHDHSSPQQAQEASVRSFYTMILTFKEGGVPSNSNIEKLAPLISKRFKSILLAALDAEDRHYKEVKNSEPPLVEGSLFFSVFEGADKFTKIERETKMKGSPSFLVTLEYGNTSDPNQGCSWQDRAILIFENGAWVVDELELLGEWQFGAKGKISDILKDTASYGKANDK